MSLTCNVRLLLDAMGRRASCQFEDLARLGDTQGRPHVIKKHLHGTADYPRAIQGKKSHLVYGTWSMAGSHASKVSAAEALIATRSRSVVNFQ